MNAVDTVRAFIAAWERVDLDAIIAGFAEDAVYHNMPMAESRGREAIGAGLAGFLGGVASAEWTVRHIGETTPGVVLTERVDVFVFKDGRRLSIPVMGVFELDEAGLIAAWRDYFDLADFTRQMG